MKQTSGYQKKMTGRKLIALLCSLMLLISSSGITAFADDGIYSDPVTAPGSKTNVTPAPETTEETPEGNPEDNPEENQEESAEPAEGDPEVTEEPDAQENQSGEYVPEDDGIVYQAGSLTAELEDCSALIEYTADARIPEEATLTLRKAEGMESYACLKSANKLLKNQEDETWKDVLADQGNQFYYLSITNAEGEEIKPTSGVILTFQQPEAPKGVSYVTAGEEATFLENNDGIIRIVGYVMDPLGYVTIAKEQIGNVTLTHKGDDFTVTATYGPDAGFPAETEMQVREILPGTEEYALYSGMTDEALNEDWAEITLERYFDIAFIANGEEMEPKGFVDVQILFSKKIEKNEETEVQAVHIENNEATVIQSETDSNEAAVHDSEAIDTVTFSSDSFSVYGVVQKKKITQKVLAADGNTYEINVTYGPEAEIPEGAELKVEEIPEGSDLWEAYREQTAAALGAADVRLPGLYDITILFEGREVEPKAPISVAITLANAEEGNEELNVVHFKEEIPQELVDAAAEEKAAKEQNPEKQAEVLALNQEEQIDSEKIDANVDGQTVTFETEGFSVYAFAYTIDTYYKTASGETYQITLKYGKEAEIPADAELKVEEIPEGSELWEAYRKQTAAALGADDVRMPGLFDISIVDGEGNKIEPKAPVNVAFRLIKEESLTQDLHVVHFKEEIPQELVAAESKAEKPATEETENQPQAQTEKLNETQTTEQAETPVPAQPASIAEEDKIASETISANVEGDTVTFDTDGFSVYAFAYTVDFYYGEFEYHLTGGGAMTLSELFALLNIDRNVADVASVTFSDPSLISVSKVEENTTVGTVIESLGMEIEYSSTMTEEEKADFESKELVIDDWILISLQRFFSHENLMITFNNGDKVVIQVEDATEYAFNAIICGQYNGQNPASLYMWSTERSNGITNYQGTTSNGKLAQPVFINVQNGFHFVTWVKHDGTIPSYETSATDYQANHLKNKETLNQDTTYICYMAPNGQYLVRYVASEHGSIDNGNRYVTDRYNKKHYYSYSGDAIYAHAKPDAHYCLEGWYDEAGNLISEDEVLNLTDVNSDTVITARFKEDEKYTINYISTWYYTNIKLLKDGSVTYARDDHGAIVSETAYGTEIKGATASTHGSGTNYSYFIGWIDSEGRRVSNNATFVPSGDQLVNNATYTAVFTATPNYVVIDSDYHCGTVGGDGGLFTGLDLENANRPNSIVLVTYNNGNLAGNLWPIEKEGYQFDHWEFNGQRINDSGTQTVTVDGQSVTRDHVILANNPGFSGRGTLRAVYKPTVTYDVGVINRVSVNAPADQRWYSSVSVKDAVQTEDNIFIQSINSGSNLSLLNKLSKETRVTQTKTGYNLLTHYIKGWIADRNVTLTNGRTINKGDLIPTDATISNITTSLKLTAVWSSTFPGKTEYNGSNGKDPRYNTNSVGFFVRIVDNVADVGQTSLYTDCLYTSRLLLSGTGRFATDNSVSGTRHDFFGNGRTMDLNNIETIDHDMRANSNGLSYSGNGYDNTQEYDSRYTGAIIGVESFPSDQTIFAQIRAWNASRHTITVSGQQVPQWMLTSDYFEIKWYVLKDQENQWHIDGMLIPKFAKLRVTKKFIGTDAAIAAGKTGFSVSAVETAPRNGKAADTHTLSLNDATADPTGTEFTWVIDRLIPLTGYTVTESGYGADGYAVATSYQIYNTKQTSGLSGHTDTASVNEVYCYPPYEDQDSYQTVAFTNVYTEPYTMTIMKQDGDTKNALPGAVFDVEIKNASTNETVKTDVLTSDASGKMAVNFQTLGAGIYTFVLSERPREGYQALDPSTGMTTITGKATVDNNGLVTLSDVNATVTGDNIVPHVDVHNPSIVYVENKPERTNITVRKQWKDVDGNNQQSGKPVTIQLLRNGVSLPGKAVVLGSSVTNPTDGIARTSSWEYTWENLAAYVDGEKAYYTVREEWIGEPGGVDSIHYNTAYNDGYETYIVVQSQTTTVSGDRTIVSVYIENTPDEGQVIFTKTDLNNRALAGAVFTLYEDSGNQTGPKQPLNVINTYPSGENGVVTIKDLSNGWYWLKETTPPTGYMANNLWYAVQIKNNDSAIYNCNQSTFVPTWVKVTSIKNEPYKANIKVIKTGVNDKMLAGAYFTLYDEAILHVIKASQPTDANGELTLDNLPAGTYKLVEDTAPTGYIALTDPITITVSADGTVTTIPSMTVTNTADNNFSMTVPNEPELTTVTVQKTWDDAANLPAGTEVAVQLSATVAGTAYNLTGVNTEQTLTGETNPAWQYTWTELPKYDEDQNLIVYSVTETRLTIGTETIAGEDLAACIMTADEADTAYSFHLKNKIPRIQKTALKKWSQNTLPEGISIKFKIKATIGDSNTDIFNSLTGTQGAQEQTLVGGTDATVTANWTAIWFNLPQYYQGQKINYTVSETEYKIGSVSYTPAQPDEPNETEYDFSFTNELPTTTRSATKTWIDNTDEENLRPDSITFTLKAFAGEEELDSEAMMAEGITTATRSAAITINKPATKTEDWPIAVWEELPVYDHAGQTITYSVAEIEVEYYSTSFVENNGVFSFTNTLNQLDIDIVKVKAGTEDKLDGAVFQLKRGKVNETDPTKMDYIDYRTPITVANGQITISNLPDGMYQLEEKQAPAGYILLNTSLEFTVSGADITYSNADDTTFKYEKEDGGKQTFTIANTPGAELPATGGSGTLIYTITGLALVLLAGVLLISRKRRFNNR